MKPEQMIYRARKVLAYGILGTVSIGVLMTLVYAACTMPGVLRSMAIMGGLCVSIFVIVWAWAEVEN